MKSGRLEIHGGARNLNFLNFLPSLLPGILALVLFAGGFSGRAQDRALEELRTAKQIRQLTAEQATQHYPVHIQGVLTFFDQSQFFRFIQDNTAGIYFYLDDPANNLALASGQLVEIEGETNPGEYAPVVTPRKIKILGAGNFPVPKPVSFERLASGQEDSQFVEIHGIVRSVRLDEQTKYYSLEIATGGGRFTALAGKLPLARSDDLVDSTIRIRGVGVTRFNQQRQLFDIRLLVPRPEDLVIETPAPGDPFAIPVQSLEKLLQFTPQGAYGHRVKVAGTVIYRQDDDTLYIQDGKEGLYVTTRQAGPLPVGSQVEVLGFPAKGEYTPMMQDAVFRGIGPGPVPDPVRVTADEALKGVHDCRLVQIEAKVLDRARHSREQFLVLESGGFIFHAYLQRKGAGTDFAYLQNGSKVRVTGVCLIETGSGWHAGADWRAKSFRILLRSAGDIFVLQQPPWWNLQKLFWAVTILGLIVLGASIWVAVLRRRVHKQTKIIRQKLQVEAALKERYENLFENANDMVFTHDLLGRITSINKAGEQLLQRNRAEILSRNLVEFVTEEQRGAAEQWLGQVVKGAELPPGEWNLLNAAGQRIRLEISTRMVASAGKVAEVEGIARDVTERKRLESEILEISTREQRRIGHDLHDGVCQQLAAIAYRLDILSDQLGEKGVPESAEADWIGGLIHEAISQTRGAARGLYPVRLEEDGLVSALEELAANTASLFNLRCRFFCENPPPIMENEVSLHLYYIVQEAVINAAKHGQATDLDISLARTDDRFVLEVRDNGVGFHWPDAKPTGMGLGIMRYRARVIGATLDLKSQLGQGTQVSCVFYTISQELRRKLEHDQRNS
ncbi:MAG: sensor signal transduction histidine kinase [Pedosphaera sp.]|nr:sensor signal transduction histidine kinase [Pedosphaera sp.]